MPATHGLLLALACFGHVAIAADSLFAVLAAVPFQNKPGLVNASEAYTFMSVPCYYLEVENVTCTDCSWGGPCAVMIRGAERTPNCSAQAPPHASFDRPGDDYQQITSGTIDECQAACCADNECMSWVYVKTSQTTFGSCKLGVPCCFLKSGVPDETPNNYPGGIWNGVIDGRGPGPNVTAPAPGVRNAVPVGGLGAGTFELRGDGTIHEMTIQNASPAGAAKFGVVADAMLAIRVGNVTRSVRTDPPAYATGVPQIAYRGSYPVSRLDVNDPTLPASASVFAYHRLRPNDAPASAAPAAIFTLSVTNTGPAAAPVALYFNLPFGGMNDCSRTGTPLSSAASASYADCLHTCAAKGTACAAWVYADGTCQLLSTAGLMVYSRGSYCGVAGAWTADSASLSLSMNSAQPGPANGDVALTPSAGGSAASWSFGVADDPAALYAAFASAGAFAPGVVNGVTGGPFANVYAAHGAAIVTTAPLAPGQSATVSIVFSWFFPNRDYYGRIVGQYYANIFNSSVQVGATLADHSSLASIASDLVAHTSIFAGPETSLPAWLADHFVNQFSHFRNFIYSGDGLMREHEANDCPDLDSVHNDYQRHLPYFWAVPDFESQKSELYENCQAADGHIPENPGFAMTDECGGRVMGDTTTIWLLELLEVWRHTNNTQRLADAWPAAIRAIKWQAGVSAEYGLPSHLVCTYDILAFEQYNTTTFNGFLHLAAMRAAVVMANALGDESMAQFAQQTFDTSLAALTGPLLWNSTYNYFRAYTGGDAIMSDCLYGQQVALAHGLGWLVDPALLAQHLEAELKYNANPFGLTVVTGRHTPPPLDTDKALAAMAAVSGTPLDEIASRKSRRASDIRTTFSNFRSDGQDDAIWMGGAPDWSNIALALGARGPAGGNVTLALEPTRWELENYRSRLNSMWDLTGISTTGDWGSDALNGQPFCTSHYGFMLTDYYLIYALSGQQTNLPNGTLSFAPLYPCPMNLPALLMGVEGTISCDAAGKHTLAIAFGTLALPAGGLSVDSKAYPNPVVLSAGQSVSW
eukprot:TRINITY_DN2576_c0_g2_i1.p1 TRINITY_DN2576_c0_g2~~TRINITY_DN2576_c0_g2_i1.p1  ORF type:complete len:1038 (+),score=373.87 TRINITY_DN2576_c0_g2_i1:144-3257(+)